jgi:outer membrane murein-binding lipoprotein Lpp
MTYAISLYDALTGINVPKNQALAVVEALERKMTSELATKSDVDQLKTDVKQLRVDVDQLKTDVKQLRVDVDQLKTDVKQLRVDVDQLRVDVRQLADGMKLLENRIVVRLGIAMGVFTTLLFAALQLTLS